MTNKTMLIVDLDTLKSFIENSTPRHENDDAWARERRVLRDKVYEAAPVMADPVNPDIESAAKKLAECMDYPWQHMVDQGRQSMRDFAKLVIEAGAGVKP